MTSWGSWCCALRGLRFHWGSVGRRGEVDWSSGLQRHLEGPHPVRVWWSPGRGSESDPRCWSKWGRLHSLRIWRLTETLRLLMLPWPCFSSAWQSHAEPLPRGGQTGCSEHQSGQSFLDTPTIYRRNWWQLVFLCPQQFLLSLHPAPLYWSSEVSETKMRCPATTLSLHFSFSLSQCHLSFLSLCLPHLWDQVRTLRGEVQVASLEHAAARRVVWVQSCAGQASPGGTGWSCQRSSGQGCLGCRWRRCYRIPWTGSPIHHLLEPPPLCKKRRQFQCVITAQWLEHQPFIELGADFRQIWKLSIKPVTQRAPQIKKIKNLKKEISVLQWNKNKGWTMSRFLILRIL